MWESALNISEISGKLAIGFCVIVFLKDNKRLLNFQKRVLIETFRIEF